jgi:hypothetical protein
LRCRRNSASAPTKMERVNARSGRDTRVGPLMRRTLSPHVARVSHLTERIVTAQARTLWQEEQKPTCSSCVERDAQGRSLLGVVRWWRNVAGRRSCRPSGTSNIRSREVEARWQSRLVDRILITAPAAIISSPVTRSGFPRRRGCS